MENNKKTDVLDNEKITPLAADNPSVESSDFGSMFDTDGFEWQRQREENGVVASNENTTVFEKKLPLLRFLSTGSDGKKYNNFQISFVKDFKGTPRKYEINVAPAQKRGAHYDMLGEIFGEETRLPVDIVKTEYERDGRKNVSYSLQMSASDDTGCVVKIPLRAVREDAVWFDYLIEVLKKNGAIT